MTEPTTPDDDAVIAPPVTPSDPPNGSGSSAGAKRDATTDVDAHDATPVQHLVQAFPNAGLDAQLGSDEGALHAMAASVVTPARKFIGAPVQVGQALTARVHDVFDPRAAGSTWGGFGSAAPRFAPWIVLLAMAWLVRTVIASILADRTAGPRRRRWTLL